MSDDPKNESLQNGYTVPGLDWDQYINLRPTYPSSVFTRIYEYHAAHHGSFSIVHDAGSGAGIAAEVLADRFSTVHISDLSPKYLAAAEARLSKRQNAARFTFHQASAEDMSWLEPGSCDAVTIFCAIHWIDTDRLWAQVARVLKPGGTFATVYYNGVPAIVNNPDAQVAWERVCASCTRNGLLQDDPALRRAFGVVCTGLDSIRPAEEHFEASIVRWRVNEEIRAEVKYLEDWQDEFTFPSSVITPKDELIDETDQENWSRELSLNEMKQLVNTLAHRGPDEELEPLYQHVEAAMQKAGQTKLKVVWSAHLLLATRTIS